MPYVSFGLPVYNGANFLTEAVESILAQTFEDFELIISDNASTDGTDAICKAYAAKDQRIRYYRNERNMGAAWNFNRVFELSSGRYFKWANHDDLIAPDFLVKCVEVLDQDPGVVLCHSKTRIVDERGNPLIDVEISLNTDSPKPAIRCRDLVGAHLCFQIFGLIRASTLRKTPLMGSYSHADGILLLRLGLLGRFHEICEYLFFFRHFPQQSTSLYFPHFLAFAAGNPEYSTDTVPDYHQWAVFFDPAKEGKIKFPHWRIMREVRKSITASPISWGEKIRCFRSMRKQSKDEERSLFRKLLIKDLIVASRTILTHLKRREPNRKSSGSD